MEENMAQSQAQRSESEEAPSAGRKPEATAKVGPVEIAIWRNKGSSGEFYTASPPVIRYKDEEEWKDGSSYGALDLLSLAEAAREASAKIRELSKNSRKNG
jgi:hypothetical protein